MEQEKKTITMAEQIETYAGLFFSREEIAIIMELGEKEIAALAFVGSPEYKAFHKGRLVAESEIRNSILEMAKKGSSPAQALAMDILKQAQLKSVNL